MKNFEGFWKYVRVGEFWWIYKNIMLMNYGCRIWSDEGRKKFPYKEEKTFQVKQIKIERSLEV